MTPLTTNAAQHSHEDLSELARKRYALLQTPEFVEQFILDRMLTPAIDTFGYNRKNPMQASRTVLDFLTSRESRCRILLRSGSQFGSTASPAGHWPAR